MIATFFLTDEKSTLWLHHNIPKEKNTAQNLTLGGFINASQPRCTYRQEMHPQQVHNAHHLGLTYHWHWAHIWGAHLETKGNLGCTKVLVV